MEEKKDNIRRKDEYQERMEQTPLVSLSDENDPHHQEICNHEQKRRGFAILTASSQRSENAEHHQHRSDVWIGGLVPLGFQTRFVGRLQTPFDHLLAGHPI